MRPIPSRQTLVSALAGGAVAAAVSVGPAVAEQTARIAATITGKDIVNNSVSSADVRDGTLAGKDVLDGGLSGADIGTGSITGHDIAFESIGGDDIRANSLGSSDILGNLDGTDIEDNSLDGADVRNDGLTGADIDESTLDIAGSDDLHVPFRTALAAGETRTIATQGPLSVDAQCQANDGGNDRVRLLARTTEANSLMSAHDSYPGGFGPGFLQPSTPADDRELAVFQFATGSDTVATRDVGSGFVMDSDGQNWIGADGDELALVLNYAGAKCFVAGVIRTQG